jgi:methionyl-tRNA formyltransferase
MKVAFFGTSDKSTPILESLNQNFDLVLCVTKHDTIVGRKKDVRETAVKRWANGNNKECVTISSLKGEDLEKVLTALENNNIALGIVADFNFIIPGQIIRKIKNGLINIHFSLLPYYRGASPVQHAILNGEQTTGITYQLLDEGMDTGDILCQIEYGLSGTETTGQLYNDLFEIAAQNLPHVLSGYISGNIKPTVQNHGQATYCYSPTRQKSTYIYKEDARINWADAPEVNERKVRAYNPWPIAWTTLGDMQTANIIKLKNSMADEPKYGNLKLKIFESEIANNKFIPVTVQVEGKNITDWKSFLNGYSESVST